MMRKWRSRPNPRIIPAGGRSSRGRSWRSGNGCIDRSALSCGKAPALVGALALVGAAALAGTAALSGATALAGAEALISVQKVQF